MRLSFVDVSLRSAAGQLSNRSRSELVTITSRAIVLNRRPGLPLHPDLRASFASDLAYAAVCHQICTGHIRTLVGTEVDCRISDFNSLG